jgi:ceramide glucosyltransferase
MYAAVLLLVFAALVFLVMQHVRLARALVDRQAAPSSLARYPALTMVRPIRGLDIGARANLLALLENEYPGELQILCVLDDATDEAYPLVRAAIAEHTKAHPDARVQLILAGTPPHGRTGKLHAMSVGVREATGELIGFTDSDTRLVHDQLRVMVERLLASDNAGAIFAPAVAAEPPRTPGDVGYALMLNSWYGAVAAAASVAVHELPFIMGQLMIFRRRALCDIGGVESADGQLVDDMYLGQQLYAHGWHNVMSERPIRIVAGALGFGEFMLLMRRWLLFSRSGLPSSFKRPPWLRGLAIAVAVTALIGALAHGWPLVALLAATTIAFACASDILLHRQFGGAPIPLKWSWLTLVVPLVGPWALASLAVDHHVAWRGRDYALDGGAHLRS